MSDDNRTSLQSAAAEWVPMQFCLPTVVIKIALSLDHFIFLTYLEVNNNENDP